MLSEQYILDKIKEYDEFKSEIEKREDEQEQAIASGMPTITNETVQTYRAVNNEHIRLAQSLDPKHIQGSDKQKHGGAAERQQVHDSNINKIKNGETPDTRLSESGIDPSTDIIEGDTPYQMKFASTPQKTYHEYMKKSTYSGVRKYCPKGQADKIREIATRDAEQYKIQAEECKKNGDIDGYEKNMAKSRQAADIAQTIEDSTVDYDKSKTIIPNRTKNAVLNVAKDCHNAGVESAKSGAMISAVFSGGQNLIAVFKGEKEFTDAMLDTIKSTAVSAANAYATGAGATLLATGAEQLGIALGNVAQNTASGAVSAAASNASSVLRAFSTTAVPAIVISGAIDFTKSIYKYSQGELTKEELGIELGRKTVGIVSSTIAGTAATALFAPLGVFAPLAGAAVSMLVYSVTTAFYDSIVETIKLSKQRKEIDRLTVMYNEAYEQLCQARREMLQFLSQQTKLRAAITEESLRNMETAIFDGDLMKFNTNLGKILNIYAEGLLFKNKNEFDTAMKSDKPIKI